MNTEPYRKFLRSLPAQEAVQELYVDLTIRSELAWSLTNEILGTDWKNKRGDLHVQLSHVIQSIRGKLPEVEFGP